MTTRFVRWVGNYLYDTALSNFPAQKAMGIDGMCVIEKMLPGMGGQPTFDRSMLQGLHDAGMEGYLGCYLMTNDDGITPMGNWFSAAALERFKAALRGYAAEIKAGPWGGGAWDGECYPAGTKEPYTKGTWSWRFPGNTHSETEVRNMVYGWGAEAGKILAPVMAGKKMFVYGSKMAAGLPGSYNEQIQFLPGNSGIGYADSVWIDFWRGVFSTWIPSYINFLSGWGETGPQGPGTYTSQVIKDYQGSFATAKARFPAAVLPNIHFTAFACVGPVDAHPAKSISEARDQLVTAATYTDGLVLNYSFQDESMDQWKQAFLDAGKVNGIPAWGVVAGAGDPVPPIFLPAEPTPKELPDLVCEFVDAPLSMLPGERWLPKVKVTNIGAVEVPVDTIIDFLVLDGGATEAWGDTFKGGLKPGMAVYIEATGGDITANPDAPAWVAPDEDGVTHIFTARVNSYQEGRFTEQNHTNNYATTTVLVKKPVVATPPPPPVVTPPYLAHLTPAEIDVLISILKPTINHVTWSWAKKEVAMRSALALYTL